MGSYCVGWSRWRRLARWWMFVFSGRCAGGVAARRHGINWSLMNICDGVDQQASEDARISTDVVSNGQCGGVQLWLVLVVLCTGRDLEPIAKFHQDGKSARAWRRIFSDLFSTGDARLVVLMALVLTSTLETNDVSKASKRSWSENVGLLRFQFECNWDWISVFDREKRGDIRAERIACRCGCISSVWCDQLQVSSGSECSRGECKVPRCVVLVCESRNGRDAPGFDGSVRDERQEPRCGSSPVATWVPRCACTTMDVERNLKLESNRALELPVEIVLHNVRTIRENAKFGFVSSLSELEQFEGMMITIANSKYVRCMKCAVIEFRRRSAGNFSLRWWQVWESRCCVIRFH